MVDMAEELGKAGDRREVPADPAAVEAVAESSPRSPVPTIKRQLSAPTPASVRRIASVAFLYMVGALMCLPLLPFVWTSTEKAGGDKITGGSLNSMGSLLNSLGELVTAATLGALSDYYGRKPFLFLSIVGTAGTFTVAALEMAGMFGSSGHIMLFCAVSFAGVCGNCFVFVKAYVADSVAEEQRAACYAKVFATVMSSFIIGPVLGMTLSRISMVIPFVLGVGTSCANMVVVARMPESLSPENRVKTVAWSKANPFGPLVFFVQSPFLCLFGFMAFLDQFSGFMITVGFVPFCAAVWEVGPEITGSLLMFFGGSTMMVMLCVVKPVLRRSGELGATKIGYALTGVSFLLIGAASYGPSPLFLLPGLALAALGAISQPAEVACASRCVDPTQQGMLQAANGSLDVVGKLTGAAIVFAVWEPSARQGHYSAIWWVASAIVAPGVLAAFLLERVMPKHLREAMSGDSLPSSGRRQVADVAEFGGAPPTILADQEGHSLDKIRVAVADAGGKSPSSPGEADKSLCKADRPLKRHLSCLQWFGTSPGTKGFNGVVSSAEI